MHVLGKMTINIPDLVRTLLQLRLKIGFHCGCMHSHLACPYYFFVLVMWSVVIA